MAEKTEPTSYTNTVAPELLYSGIPRTADNVIRRAIVEAIRADLITELPERGPEDETREQKIARWAPFYHGFYRTIYNASTADLLQRIHALDPAAADAAAEHIVESLEDGSYWPEVIWDWATERGIDPQRIRAEAEAELARANTPAPTETGEPS